MKQPKNLPIASLALVSIACLVGYYATREGPAPRANGKQAAAAEPSLIDERLLKTARQTAALADTPEEQELAGETLRLSDHELDQAFATALREASTPDPKAAATGPLQQLTSRIAQLKAKVSDSKDRVDQLTKQAAAKPSAADQLELAKAQLELDQDDLDDAQQDLKREGGDPHDRLERARQEHEAAQQGIAPLPKLAPLPPADTLKDQMQQWLALNAKAKTLAAAAQQAAAKAAALLHEHNGLESKDGTPPASDAASDDGDGEDTASMIDRLRKLSDVKRTLTELDKRTQDSQQLADAYKSWGTLVEARRRAMLHLLLRALAAIFGILLLLAGTHRLVLYAVRNQDRRKLHQARVISAIAGQFIGVIAILLIVFGPPTQVSTMIGLATAGLTVVLKDFIVGFLGWFVLMGRSGVRIGDWVEIKGVGGEVIEIGVLKTVLLEMGNTSTGHPTGRRVSFSNSYAIEGVYFNFSTVGQWLWDELQVTLPAGGDPYQVAEQIRQRVDQETQADAVEAAQDWERVTHQYGVGTFSAKPAVDIRPGSNGGLDVVVRYITRAPRRYEVKSKLFQSIVELLHGSAGEPARLGQPNG